MEVTYKEFIDNILSTRSRFACGDEYHERHHIVPKCMGGTNDEENLIDLFAREHFEAHRLLALENPKNNKLTHAWWMMCHIGRIEISKDEYEEARINVAKFMSIRDVSDETRKKMSKAKQNAYLGENNPFYGKKHTTETKKRMKENHINVFGENNPFFRNKHTEETKKAISKKNSKSVYCIETGIIYYNISEAGEKTNTNRRCIGYVCGGRLKTAGKCRWKYLYDQIRKDGTIIPGAITLGLITEEEALNKLKKEI